MGHVPQVVEAAVQAAPPRFGLEASARLITGNERWEDGIKWQPEQCAGAGRISIDACDTLDPVAAASTPAEATSHPFLVYAGETCSTFGINARDWNGRARRQLLATRSAQIAAELEGGSLGGDGLALTDATSDVLTTSPVDPVHALALLEAGLANYLAGRQGMVHVTPQLLTHLAAEGAVRLEGNFYTSPSGHLIVADAGYTGARPSGAGANYAAQWAYGTAVVALRFGPIVFNPRTLDLAQGLLEAMDRSTNTVTVIAEQTVVIQLDPCAHVAAQVDLAPPAIGGAS